MEGVVFKTPKPSTINPAVKPHLVSVPQYLVARHDGFEDRIRLRALQALGIKLAKVHEQVANLEMLVTDLRGVRERLGLAAPAVSSEGAGRLDGVVVRLEGPELGGLGEGAAAEAADAGDKALAGERAIAEQDEGGARDLADALTLEGERLAGELDGLAALREVDLAGRNRGRPRLGCRGGRRRRFRRCGGHGEEAAAVVEGDAAAEAADGERGDGVGSHEMRVPGCGGELWNCGWAMDGGDGAGKNATAAAYKWPRTSNQLSNSRPISMGRKPLKIQKWADVSIVEILNLFIILYTPRLITSKIYTEL